MDSAFLSRLRDFDAYPKTLQDYQVRTLAGAAVSVAGMLLMLLLFFGELSLYLTVQTDHQLSVDTTRGEKLQAPVLKSQYNGEFAYEVHSGTDWRGFLRNRGR